MWHVEILSAAADETLQRLSALEPLQSFYLAGGTGLALQLGHRRSADLGFFSEDAFDEDMLLSSLRPLENVVLVAKAQETLHLHITDTKVSFFGYHYPRLFPLGSFSRLAVADVQDIAGMKLSALASRGTRRDFVDLYTIAKQYGLAATLEQLERKYSQVRYNKVHILKSLIYFVDAEKEPMPDMLVPISWEEVKTFFLREVPILVA